MSIRGDPTLTLKGGNNHFTGSVEALGKLTKLETWCVPTIFVDTQYTQYTVAII